MTERNTMPTEAGQDMAVHENTLIPLNEAKARQAAEEERFRRQWEDTLSTQPTGGCYVRVRAVVKTKISTFQPTSVEKNG